MENYKLKKKNFFNTIHENEKNNYKLWWHGNQKGKTFTNIKALFLIEKIDIDKTVVSNKVSLGIKGFKYFTGYKDTKKLDLYAYFFQKWVHIEEILMKQNMCIFW